MQLHRKINQKHRFQLCFGIARFHLVSFRVLDVQIPCDLSTFLKILKYNSFHDVHNPVKSSIVILPKSKKPSGTFSFYLGKM